MKSLVSLSDSADRFVESVLMYVIRPVGSPPLTAMPSYSDWAVRIARSAVMPSRRAASCCMVLVMNGAAGRDLLSFVSTEATLNLPTLRSSTIFPASSPLVTRMRPVFPSIAWSAARNLTSGLPWLERDAYIFQYSSGLKAPISRSRSTMRRSATDWTRPAERPLLILPHRTGLNR